MSKQPITTNPVPPTASRESELVATPDSSPRPQDTSSSVGNSTQKTTSGNGSPSTQNPFATARRQEASIPTSHKDPLAKLLGQEGSKSSSNEHNEHLEPIEDGLTLDDIVVEDKKDETPGATTEQQQLETGSSDVQDPFSPTPRSPISKKPEGESQQTPVLPLLFPTDASPTEAKTAIDATTKGTPRSLLTAIVTIAQDNPNALDRIRDIISQYNGDTPLLHLAIKEDNVEALKLLIQAGASVDARNADDKTALDLAQDKGHTQAIAVLNQAILEAAQSPRETSSHEPFGGTPSPSATLAATNGKGQGEAPKVVPHTQKAARSPRKTSPTEPTATQSNSPYGGAQEMPSAATVPNVVGQGGETEPITRQSNSPFASDTQARPKQSSSSFFGSIFTSKTAGEKAAKKSRKDLEIEAERDRKDLKKAIAESLQALETAAKQQQRAAATASAAQPANNTKRQFDDLVKKINSGELAELKSSIQSNTALLAYKDDSNRTLLMHAAKKSNTEAAKALIDAIKGLADDDRKAALDAQSKEGQKTALMYATRNNNMELATALMKAGADISIKDKKGETAFDIPKSLMQLVKLNNAETAKTLIDAIKGLAVGDKKAALDAQSKDSQKTSLMYAVEKGNTELATALIDAGADISIKDKSGQTAFDLCRDDALKAILTPKAHLPKAAAVKPQQQPTASTVPTSLSPEAAPTSSAQPAAAPEEQSRSKTVQANEGTGAVAPVPNLPKAEEENDDLGLSTLFPETPREQQRLQPLTSPFSAADTGEQQTPITINQSAVQPRVTGAPAPATVLPPPPSKRAAAKRETPPAIPNRFKSTAAATSGDQTAGAPQTQQQQPPAPASVLLSSQQQISELVITTQPNKGNTMPTEQEELTTQLFEAVSQNNAEQIASLVAKGANVDATNNNDEQKRTPLHYAIIAAKTDAVTALMENGANLNLSDYQGKTPMDLAVSHNQPTVAYNLAVYGAKFDYEKVLLLFPGNLPEQEKKTLEKAIQGGLEAAKLRTNVLEGQPRSSTTVPANEGTGGGDYNLQDLFPSTPRQQQPSQSLATSSSAALASQQGDGTAESIEAVQPAAPSLSNSAASNAGGETNLGATTRTAAGVGRASVPQTLQQQPPATASVPLPTGGGTTSLLPTAAGQGVGSSLKLSSVRSSPSNSAASNDEKVSEQKQSPALKLSSSATFVDAAQPTVTTTASTAAYQQPRQSTRQQQQSIPMKGKGTQHTDGKAASTSAAQPPVKRQRAAVPQSLPTATVQDERLLPPLASTPQAKALTGAAATFSSNDSSQVQTAALPIKQEKPNIFSRAAASAAVQQSQNTQQLPMQGQGKRKRTQHTDGKTASTSEVQSTGTTTASTAAADQQQTDGTAAFTSAAQTTVKRQGAGTAFSSNTSSQVQPTASPTTQEKPNIFSRAAASVSSAFSSLFSKEEEIGTPATSTTDYDYEDELRKTKYKYHEHKNNAKFSDYALFFLILALTVVVPILAATGNLAPIFSNIIGVEAFPSGVSAAINGIFGIGTMLIGGYQTVSTGHALSKHGDVGGREGKRETHKEILEDLARSSKAQDEVLGMELRQMRGEIARRKAFEVLKRATATSDISASQEEPKDIYSHVPPSHSSKTYRGGSR